MATVSKKFRSAKRSITPEVVAKHLKFLLSKEFDGANDFADFVDTPEFTGKPKENAFVTCEVSFDIVVAQGNEVKIVGNVKPSPGPAFWLCAIAGLFTGFMFLVAFGGYLLSAGLPEKEVTQILDTLETRMT